MPLNQFFLYMLILPLKYVIMELGALASANMKAPWMCRHTGCYKELYRGPGLASANSVRLWMHTATFEACYKEFREPDLHQLYCTGLILAECPTQNH